MKEFEAGLEAFQSADYQSALRIWTSLAEAGDAQAQLKLGALYFAGSIVPKNDRTALEWTCLAAEQGIAEAQVHAGWMFMKGLGGPPNLEEGYRLLSHAAEQGFGAAQFSVGWLYFEGVGVPKDHVQAYKWAHLAAEGGNANGAELRAQLAQTMTAQEIRQAQQLALDWRRENEASSRKIP